MTDAREKAFKAIQKVEDELLQKSALISLEGPRRAQVQVFHALYDCPMADTTDENISHMDDDRIGLRLSLILEEAKELLRDGFGVDTEFTFYTEGGEEFDSVTEAVKHASYRNPVEAMDALGDLSYVIDGFAIEIGANLDEVINEIHASNLTKLGENGKPIYREDGKVLKGPDFTKPNLNAIVLKKDKRNES